MNKDQLNDATAPRSVDQQQACSARCPCCGLRTSIWDGPIEDAGTDRALIIAILCFILAVIGEATPPKVIIVAYGSWWIYKWFNRRWALCKKPNASDQTPAAQDSAMRQGASSRLSASVLFALVWLFIC